MKVIIFKNLANILLNSKSENCTQSEHGSCKGIEIISTNGSKATKVCSCPCHNNMYNLIKNTIAVAVRNNSLYNDSGDSLLKSSA
jgi:hypothetical protein